MKHKLVMHYPAAWHKDMWREGAPFGNGLIGGMVYGGIFQENILLNHAFLWRGGKEAKLPDIHDILPKIRKLLDEKEVRKADALITEELLKRGYNGEHAAPFPVADIVIKTPSRRVFSNYRREIDMEKALITVSWKEEEIIYKRETFVSRADHKIFTRYTCSGDVINTKIAVTLHDQETLENIVIPELENYSKGDCSYFAAYNDSIYRPGDYGVVCKVFADGELENEGPYVCVKNASEILIVAEIFLQKNRKEGFAGLEEQLNKTFDFDQELDAHTKLHRKIFQGVDFSITDFAEDTCNEELLLNAFEESASNELFEKLYAYGRYLFICSTDEKNTLPCHLTGLFNGTYQCFWAFYMYNVNFEMIYWQALSGGLPGFLRLALDYTESLIPDLQENAKKIFGCRGILINSVNCPDSGLYKCLGHHIVNWTGGAAWFSQHFYDYFRYTQDMEYLKVHAMPFMYETALFYEDFVVENEDGYFDLYPCVSPENTASNVWAAYGENETCKNATMEIALLKELLTNLLEASRLTGLYTEKVDTWKYMLSKIRPYMINEDGAIREWADPYYMDNYCHRHHSHLYPVFPGSEITRESDLYPAFEKAEELRLKFGLSDQSSWSMVYMAGVAARMEKGETAMKALDIMSRTCLMNNFLTVHNDWRRMGPVSCGDFRVAPFQVDGNIGFCGVVNEMLLQSQKSSFEESRLTLLPALPERWRQGHICGLRACGNVKCDLYWTDMEGYAVLKCGVRRKVSLTIGDGWTFKEKSHDRYAEWEANINACAQAGEKKSKRIEFQDEIRVDFIRTGVCDGE